jgi:hypothetical protein
MLSASLSILSASLASPSKPSTSDSEISESQPLLGWRRPTPVATEGGGGGGEGVIRRKPAALSAFLGISAGTGALLAVFVFLRIPTWIGTSSSSPENTVSSTRGLRMAFYMVAGLAVFNALIAYIALPSNSQTSTRKTSDEGTWAYIKHEIGHILNGFRLAGRNANIALACAGGFAARAQTISVS